MRCFIGIDFGSTTTKAVVVDAKQEALVNGRFFLFRQALGTTGALNGSLDAFLGQLERDFRSEQYLEQLGDLAETCQRSLATAKFGAAAGGVSETLAEVFRRITAEAPLLFAPGANRKSDFFR